MGAYVPITTDENSMEGVVTIIVGGTIYSCTMTLTSYGRSVGLVSSIIDKVGCVTCHASGLDLFITHTPYTC